MNTPCTSIRLPVVLADKLKALSAETDFSVAALIVACVNRALPYVEQKALESKQSNPAS